MIAVQLSSVCSLNRRETGNPDSHTCMLHGCRQCARLCQLNFDGHMLARVLIQDHAEADLQADTELLLLHLLMHAQPEEQAALALSAPASIQKGSASASASGRAKRANALTASPCSLHICDIQKGLSLIPEGEMNICSQAITPFPVPLAIRRDADSHQNIGPAGPCLDQSKSVQLLEQVPGQSLLMHQLSSVMQ